MIENKKFKNLLDRLKGDNHSHNEIKIHLTDLNQINVKIEYWDWDLKPGQGRLQKTDCNEVELRLLLKAIEKSKVLRTCEVQVNNDQPYEGGQWNSGDTDDIKALLLNKKPPTPIHYLLACILATVNAKAQLDTMERNGWRWIFKNIEGLYPRAYDAVLRYFRDTLTHDFFWAPQALQIKLHSISVGIDSAMGHFISICISPFILLKIIIDLSLRASKQSGSEAHQKHQTFANFRDEIKIKINIKNLARRYLVETTHRFNGFHFKTGEKGDILKTLSKDIVGRIFREYVAKELAVAREDIDIPTKESTDNQRNLYNLVNKAFEVEYQGWNEYKDIYQAKDSSYNKSFVTLYKGKAATEEDPTPMTTELKEAYQGKVAPSQ